MSTAHQRLSHHRVLQAHQFRPTNRRRVHRRSPATARYPPQASVRSAWWGRRSRRPPRLESICSVGRFKERIFRSDLCERRPVTGACSTNRNFTTTDYDDHGMSLTDAMYAED